MRLPMKTLLVGGAVGAGALMVAAPASAEGAPPAP